MDNRASGLKGLFFMFYASYWLPKILGVADVLIASSLDYIAASDAAKLYEDQTEKWIGLPFGVDIERFQPQVKPADLFLTYNLDPQKPTLVFVGGMDSAHYFKGVDVLLKALLLAKKNGSEFHAVLVGDGELREKYELTAQGYGLDAVRFVGYVDADDLPRYYAMADVCVLPSTTRGEAFGMVLLEAMASGVPVIASDLPGVRTVAADGGITVAPGNYTELAAALIEYFSTNKSDMSRQVRTIVEEKYSWNAHAATLEEVYNKLYKN